MLYLPYVLYAIVLGTIVWTFLDAYHHKIPTSGVDYSIHTGALTWLLGCLVIWIFVFPFYLIKRAQIFKSRNKVSVASLMGSVLYVTALLILLILNWPYLSQLG